MKNKRKSRSVITTVCWYYLICPQVFWLVGCVGPPTVIEMSIEDRTTLKVKMTREVTAVTVNSWVVLTPGLVKKVIEPDTIKAIGVGKDWKVDLEKLDLPARIGANASGGTTMKITGPVNLTAEWVSKSGTPGKKDFSVFVEADIIYEEGVSRRRLSAISIEEDR